MWTFRDGPYQHERDRQLKEHPPFEGYPNPFSDTHLQKWLYDYDIAKTVGEAWARYTSGAWAGTSGGYVQHDEHDEHDETEHDKRDETEKRGIKRASSETLE
jgi:salicylate hydroxylase